MPRWLSRILDHLVDLPPALREQGQASVVLDVQQSDEPPDPELIRAYNRLLRRQGLRDRLDWDDERRG
jgi:hypothetical protein